MQFLRKLYPYNSCFVVPQLLSFEVGVALFVDCCLVGSCFSRAGLDRISNRSFKMENITIPLILDGTFFVVKDIDKSGMNVKAKCKLCVNKELSGRLDATSNFLKHLKVSLLKFIVLKKRKIY